VRNINIIRDNINSIYAGSIDALNNITLELRLTNEIKRVALTQIVPMLIAVEQIADDAMNLAQTFEAGMIELMKGRITAALVSEGSIANVIQYVSNTVLTNREWQGYGLISSAPSYYYRVQDIAFVRSETHLLLTMNFPLIRLSGRMLLYRLDVLPVPLTAGLKETAETGHTLVQGLPGFIAISEDAEQFVELTTAQYLTCKGDVLKTCGDVCGGILRDKNSMTCAFAIFVDNHVAIKQLCDIAYTKDQITGRAIQLAANGRYLTYSGGEQDNWLLSCSSPVASLQHISPCSYCQIDVPCGCSMTAKYFLIPHSISNCAKNTETTTMWYTCNTAMVTSVLTDDDMRNIRSYETSINQLFPPLCPLLILRSTAIHSTPI
jgi:hypothetical protein